jgi:hypothetical protein
MLRLFANLVNGQQNDLEFIFTRFGLPAGTTPNAGLRHNNMSLGQEIAEVKVIFDMGKMTAPAKPGLSKACGLGQNT